MSGQPSAVSTQHPESSWQYLIKAGSRPLAARNTRNAKR